MLGFQHEGPLRAYGEDGSDYERWSLIAGAAEGAAHG
jgi:hypothetical protein